MVSARRVFGAALVLALAGLLACGGRTLPEPIREPPCITPPCRAAHEGEDPVLVPFPPPPAKVDVIGDPPTDMTDPVWVDGQWEWRGRGWVWEPGKWWQRPAAQYWAAPAVVRRADGQLVWFAGSFRPFGSPVPGATSSTPRPPPAPGPGPSARGGLSSPGASGDNGRAP
jgi:hypothetical protein